MRVGLRGACIRHTVKSGYLGHFGQQQPEGHSYFSVMYPKNGAGMTEVGKRSGTAFQPSLSS